MKVNLHESNQRNILSLQEKVRLETGKIHTAGHLTNLALMHYFSTMIPNYEDLHNANYNRNKQAA